MTIDITSNITIAETFFTERNSGWQQFDLLPFVHFSENRVLIGWLCFTVDIHKKE